ncbi:hypothetical protein ACFQ6C_25880 [Streptomyces sp. NPDC056454]|uniref:hypothetical protein n=1 Tax=Streptomyces sp. NPDC056454 TaxID=3345823 RepID=UPI003674FCEE
MPINYDPTPPQERAIVNSDPYSGLLRGAARILRPLVKKGIADPSHCGFYLSEHGRSLRVGLTGLPDTLLPGSLRPDTMTVIELVHRTGKEQASRVSRAAGRREQLDTAWGDILAQRAAHLRDRRVPLLWEEIRTLRAVSIALEVSGLPPAARHGENVVEHGYLVESAGAPATAKVSWCPRYSWTLDGNSNRRPDAELDQMRRHAARLYADALEDTGWSCTMVASTYGTGVHLLVRPRRP